MAPSRVLVLLPLLIGSASLAGCGDRPSGDEVADESGESGDGDGDGSTHAESTDASDTSSDGDGSTGGESTDASDASGTSGDDDGSTSDESGDGDTSSTSDTTGEGDTSSTSDTTGDGDGDGDTTTTGDPPSFDACGFPDDDGPWVEIEYWQLGSISSPEYSYSNTPGWGETEWAAAGMSWPEIWAFGGGNSMSNDPIGIVASISGTWQMMIGLQGLVDYDYASVCVEGRSISVGSSAIFDVGNPANGCGVEAEISNTWDVHAVAVDLGDCLTPGQETQAVRIDPWGGSGIIGIKRVRVTLHGAIY
jgi:hypothetical protein